MTFTESTIEQATINWLQELGYDYAFGPEIAFDGNVLVMRLSETYEKPSLYEVCGK